MPLAAALYAVFVAYPSSSTGVHATAGIRISRRCWKRLFLFRRANGAPWGRPAGRMVGIIPVAEGVVLALVLQQLLRVQPAEERDLGRLAVVAAASLSFATVAIPLQLESSGSRSAGRSKARRSPGCIAGFRIGPAVSRGALLAVVFVRLALNPKIFVYEPRGSMRMFNWYLYTYLTCSAAHVRGRMVAVEDRRSAR